MINSKGPGVSLDFQIHLTNACNLRCKHCYSKPAGTYLTSEQFDHAFHEVLKYMVFLKAAPGRVTITGGEPTLSPLLFDTIGKCIRSGFARIALLTNGTLITDSLARKLKKYGCTQAQICIEGNRETHNAIRGGTFDQVVKAWEICRRNGIAVFNQTTINPLNYRQVDDIVNACKGNVLYTRFLRQIPHNGKLGALTASEWMDFIGRILFAYRKDWPESLHFIRVKDVYWSHVFRSMPYRCPFNVEKYPLLPTIECNGDVYVCRRSNIVVGNILQNDLKTIFEKSDVLYRTWQQKDLNVRCGTCQELDRCGGCRGMALAVNGDIMAEDPHCFVSDIPKEWFADAARTMGKTQRRPAARDNVKVTTEEVLRYLKLKGTFSLALRQVAERKLTLKAAGTAGIRISPGELQRGVNTFRAGHGLKKATDTRQWLKSNGVSVEGLQNFVRANLFIDKFKKTLAHTANEKNGHSSRPLKNFVEEKVYREWLNQLLP